MKLNKLIYGVLSCFCLFSCADQMEYKEYSNYDADYVNSTLRRCGWTGRQYLLGTGYRFRQL